MQMANKSILFEGFNAVRSAICGIEIGVSHREVQTVFFAESRLKKKGYEYSWLQTKANSLSFSLQILPDAELAQMCSSSTSGGIAGLFSERAYGTLDQLDKASLRRGGSVWYLAAEGIEDPYNLGYIICSAYVFGCSAVLLPDRFIFGSDNILCRSSAGASERLPIFRLDLPVAVRRLIESGFSVYAATEKNALPIEDASFPLPLCIAIGGEKRGLSSALLAECDERVVIGYARNVSSSLSAVSAADILAYEIARKNKSVIKRERYENF